MSKFIDRGDVHYRIAGLTLDTARVACVQDFDYYDYEGFLTEHLFETKEEAQDWPTVHKTIMHASGLSVTGQISDLLQVIANKCRRIKELVDEL